jgi:hypothetical protein
MNLYTEFEAEVRDAKRCDVSEAFYGAYTAYLAASRRKRLALLEDVFGSVPEADARLIERQTRPLSRGEFLRSLRKLPLDERVALAHSIAEAASPVA